MNSDDLKVLVQFLRKENVAHFKCQEFELVFHPTAFVPDMGGMPVAEKKGPTDDELLFASSN